MYVELLFVNLVVSSEDTFDMNICGGTVDTAPEDNDDDEEDED